MNGSPSIDKSLCCRTKAFPPVLSPLELELEGEQYSETKAPYHFPPYRTIVILTDGGVYDNPGLETACQLGYAVCDAALRSASMRGHLDEQFPPPAGFPYPEVGVG